VAATLQVAGWGGRYRRRVDSWRLPTSQAKRDELALAYGRDGYALLTAVYGAGAPGWLAELPAVEALRVVLVQNYLRTTGEDGREVVTRREDTDGLPPGRCRLTSPYDTDARCGGKRDMYGNGYTLHISETCGDTAETAPAGASEGPQTRRPNLVTNVATTHASVTDAAMTTPIHRQLAGRGLLPDRHYVDSGYPSADLLVSSKAEFGITIVTPLLADTSPQARAGAGYDRTAFTLLVPGRPLRAEASSALGLALATRYELTGRAADLDEAARHVGAAVDESPTWRADRARHLSNHGVVLHTRFELTGAAVDLDAAVEVLEASVDATDANDIRRAGRLANLSAALHARWLVAVPVGDVVADLTGHGVDGREGAAVDGLAGDDPEPVEWAAGEVPWLGPFPSAPRRTRRAALTATGFPVVMPWVAW
jgi:hypothetical protein